ncbi:MAG: sensor domain-containing diguanylate cyclase, partial [Rhodospirillales bacterium]|nr:sensor domain-containing diguanylate cyclase [Rhodospirillales bacterium]
MFRRLVTAGYKGHAVHAVYFASAAVPLSAAWGVLAVTLAGEGGAMLALAGVLPAMVAGGLHARQTLRRRRAEWVLALAGGVYAASRQAMVLLDGEGRVLETNAAFTRLTGREAAGLEGLSAAEFQADKLNPAPFVTQWAEARAEGEWCGQVWLRDAAGEPLAVEACLTIREGYGLMSLSAADRNEMVLHDALTGLPNHVLMLDRLRMAVAACNRVARKAAVVLIDLDQFGTVNSILGAEAGDDVLREVARRLRGCVRETDTVARLSGDRFLAVLQNLDEAAGAAKVARGMLDDLRRPVLLESGRSYHVSACIGIAVHPEDGEDAGSLIARATAALEQAKTNGPNGV